MISKSLYRKSFHVGGTLLFPILAFFVSTKILLILIGATLAAFVSLEILRFAFVSVNYWVLVHLSVLFKEQETWQLTGSTYLLASSFLTFFLFEKSIAITALFFLAIGDPAAAIVGGILGKKRVFGKSLEGSLACVGACLMVGLFLTRTSLSLTPWLIVAGAISTAIIELLPIPVDDNFTIPLSSAAAMALVSLC